VVVVKLWSTFSHQKEVRASLFMTIDDGFAPEECSQGVDLVGGLRRGRQEFLIFVSFYGWRLVLGLLVNLHKSHVAGIAGRPSKLLALIGLCKMKGFSLIVAICCLSYAAVLSCKRLQMC